MGPTLSTTESSSYVLNGQAAPSQVRLLEVKNLRTQFATGDGLIRAVDDVSFDVAAGETLGIVGESGSGKSITSLSIMGLVPKPGGRIASGQILFGGRDLVQAAESEMRRIRGNRIAMVFQDPMTSLNPVLRVGRQLTEGLKLHMKLTSGQARARAAELLSIVGIPDAKRRLNDYPHQFSGGMRQRVMIAMALSCNPELLIADEPTTALDVTIQAQILELIKRLQAELRMAVILITHDLGIVAGMTDKVVVMYAGRVVEEAPTGELFSNPRMPYTIGLLRSIPRLDEEKGRKLRPIPGTPPDLARLPRGCPFSPRCEYFVAGRCDIDEPALRSVAPGHRIACHFDIEARESVQPRWPNSETDVASAPV